MRKDENIAGMKFGYLTAMYPVQSTLGSKRPKWVCHCKCGNEATVDFQCLVYGHTTSCGCKKYETKNATHGMTHTRLYSTWGAIKNRCRRENDRFWKNYGGRGIKVCDDWSSDFVNFYNWAICNGYADNLTIDRIDVNGDYCPENCRWISNEEQQRNKTNTVFVIYNGEKRCLRTLCTEIGFPYKTAHRRYTRLKAKGKEISADYLFAPIQKNKISKCYRHE